MDLFDVFRACFRRWYVVLPLILAVGAYAHHVYRAVTPVYYSNAIVGLAPPNSRIYQSAPGAPVEYNGLLDSAGGPSIVCNLAVFGLRDRSTVEQVVAGGGKSDYWVRMFPVPPNSPDIPMIMIESTQPDPITTKKTVELVVAQADGVFRDIQTKAGVSEEQMVKPLVASPPTNPAPATPSRTRATMTILLAGVLIAILIAVLADVMLLRFKARRSAKSKHESHLQGRSRTAASDPRVEFLLEKVDADQ